MKKTIFLLILSTQVLAREVPHATDYDVNPAQLFSPKFMADQPFDENVELKLELVGDLTYKPSTSDRISEVLYDKTTMHAHYDHTRGVDWQALTELSESARSTWNEALASVRGDERKARDFYMRNGFDRKVNEKIKALHAQVESFLGSSITDVPSLSRIANVTCEGNWCQFDLSPKVDRAIVYARELAAFHLHDYVDLVNQIPEINLHPLLIQILLENLAAGYPINYGTKACIALSCPVRALFGQHMILNEDISWGLRGYSDNVGKQMNREEQLKFAINLLDSNEKSTALPVLTSEQVADVRVSYLRQALNATRILNHVALGKLNCGRWGLWPKLSVDLLAAFALSEYQLNGHRYDFTDLDFLTIRLSESCETRYVPGINAPGATGEGPKYFARVGAWRKLLGEWLK